MRSYGNSVTNHLPPAPYVRKNGAFGQGTSELTEKACSGMTAII